MLVCFKIFHIIRKLVLLSFKFHVCLLSSVLVLLFGSLKEALWFANLVLKVFSFFHDCKVHFVVGVYGLLDVWHAAVTNFDSVSVE